MKEDPEGRAELGGMGHKWHVSGRVQDPHASAQPFRQVLRSCNRHKPVAGTMNHQ